MNYDFETLISRKGTGSIKWEQMYHWNPQVENSVIPLSVADMELKTAPEIIEGLKSFLDQSILGYTKAYPDYFAAITSWMERRHQFSVHPDWIVNTTGVVTALYNAVRVFSQPRDGVVIMGPVYYPFYKAVIANERTLVDCPLINDHGYYKMDLDKFDKLTRQKANKLFIFCSPHNPVGRVWTKQELEQLAQIIIRNRVLVLSDEIHHDLIMPGYKHIVFQTISEELANQVITCTAPSKTFNLAGLGISNIIISNPDQRLAFQKGLQEIASWSYSVMGFKACELAYRFAEPWLEELIGLIDRNQRLVTSYCLNHFPEIGAPLIEGTYLQWLDFRKIGWNNMELEQFLHEEAQLFLNSGNIFGETGSGFARINLAAPTWVIQEALVRFGKALNNNHQYQMRRKV